MSEEEAIIAAIYVVFEFIGILIYISIFVLAVIFIRKLINKNSNLNQNSIIVNSKSENKIVYNDIPKSKLAQFNTDDIDTLKEYFYDMFVNFEKAYNDLDYNTMRLLSTEQIFQNYHTGMKLDLKAGRKKIITDIERKKVVIFELESTITKQIASVMIEIAYINYTTDNNGHVISGNKHHKVTEQFEVVFKKIFDKNEITKCPNCGAEIIGNKCDFCGSTIKNVEFRISSIKKISTK